MSTCGQALPHGHPGRGFAQHPGQREPAAGLANVRGVRPGTHPLRIARPLYADDDLGLDLDNPVFSLDASTIDLCLSVFPWALFRSTKSGGKLHALLDLRGSIPTFVHVSHAKPGDVDILDLFLPEPGTFYVMDRAYLDFGRLHTLHSAGAFFVIRAKSNTKFRRRYSREVDNSMGVLCDQTVPPMGSPSSESLDMPRESKAAYVSGPDVTVSLKSAFT